MNPSHTNNSLTRRNAPIIKRPRPRSRLVFSSDPPKPQPTRQSSRKSLREDPEMQALRDKLYENQDFSEIETPKLDELFCSLREYAQHQGAASNYDEAQKAMNLSEAIRTELRIRDPIRDPTSLNEATARQQAFDETWQNKFDEFDQDSADRLSALEEEHKRQITEFEQLWSEEMPRQYRKASPSLLQLRHIEKSLAVCAQFDRAKVIHDEAETLAAHEWDLQQSNLIHDYQFAKDKLLSKHRSEIENLRQTRAHERALLADQCDRARVAITNRFLVVNVKRDEVEKGYRTWNRARSAVGRSGTYAMAYDRAGIQNVLLQPLRPPNDTEWVETAQKKRKEDNRKKQEFQKRNAEITMMKLLVHRGELTDSKQKQETTSTQQKQTEESQQSQENQQQTEQAQPSPEDQQQQTEESQQSQEDEPQTNETQQSQEDQQQIEQTQPSQENQQQTEQIQQSQEDEQQTQQSQENQPKTEEPNIEAQENSQQSNQEETEEETIEVCLEDVATSVVRKVEKCSQDQS